MRSQSQRLLRFLSLGAGNPRRQPPYYFLVPKPVGHHPYHNKTRLKTKGQDHRAHENMAGILILMDYPWISPHRHPQQNGVGEAMVTYPPMVIEETATACKSIKIKIKIKIKMATIIRMSHQYQYRPLITPPQKMAMAMAMAWTWMKMPMRLAAPLPTMLH